MMNTAFLNAERFGVTPRLPAELEDLNTTLEDVLDYDDDGDDDAESEDGYASSDEEATEVDEEEVLKYDEEEQDIGECTMLLRCMLLESEPRIPR